MSSGSEIPIKQVLGIPNAGPMPHAPNLIVLHHTGVSAEEAIKLFTKSRGKSSSHYLIKKTGEILQITADDRIANHISSDQPEKQRSIGIEIENSGHINDQYTNAQYNAIKVLLERLEKKHNISHDDTHIKAHYEVDYKRSKDKKWDPSPNFDWSKIGLPNHPTLKTIMVNAKACQKYYNLWENGCTDKCEKYGMKKGDYATGQTCQIIFAH